MEALITLIGLGLFLVLIVFPIWAIVRLNSLGRENDALASHLSQVEADLRETRAKVALLANRPSTAAPAPAVVATPMPVAPPAPPAPPPPEAAPIAPSVITAASVIASAAPAAPLAAAPDPIISSAPPPLPPPPPPLPVHPVAETPPAPSVEEPPLLPPVMAPEIQPPALAPMPAFLSEAAAAASAPAGAFKLPPRPERPEPPPASPINWEQFMGVKLFAWLGGLAGLLAVGFFAKYSFEHNWIPPELRMAIGFLFAIGLVIGGLKIDRVRYAVGAQTLIATGIVSLYTITFACRAIYHFAFFGPVPTFLLMVLVTTTAFLLAVRLEAQVIAVLGILGGFLTPLLVSTGQDNPLGLFGYIALLDAGLVAVALHRRWLYLVPLGALGTIIMQIGWAVKFFENDPSRQGTVAVIVCLGFAALFLGATIFARRRECSAPELTWSAILMACVCYGFGVYLVDFPVVGTRVGLLFLFALLANVCLLTLAWFEGLAPLVALAAAGTALLLGKWGAEIFTPGMAPTAMGVCLGFCAFFLATYFAARRFGRAAREITWSAVALPLVAFGFALFFLKYPEIGARVGLFYAFVLAATLCLFVLAWFEPLPVLVGGAALGVALVQAVWLSANFTAALAPTAMGICLGFCTLFLAAYLAARRGGRRAKEVTWAAVALPIVAFGFAFFFLASPAVAARPGMLFTFVLLADVMLLVIAWCDEEMPQLHLVAGAAVFVLLAAWTGGRLTAPLLPWALAFYLLHAVLHTAFPLLLERHRPAAAPAWWSQLFPPMALLLMLLPLFKLEALSIIFWPCVLLVDLIAIALAVVTASIAAVGVVLVLTLIATGVWIFHVPATVAAAPSLLLVIGGFAVLFFAAGIFLARKFGDQLTAAVGDNKLPAFLGNPRAQIPACSALLPFLLLIMMTARLPLGNPSPVFGLALLLVVMVLGLAAILELEWLPACALAGVAGLEYSWRARHFAVEDITVPLVWYLAFYTIFAAYPFVFRRRFLPRIGPWAVAAFGGVAQFPLVYRLVQGASQNQAPHLLGLLPALFAVAPLLSLVVILRSPTANARARLNQLALFGGVALLFITLIFPIQFERQWLTLGWALEGAALLWLFHRVPHPGLRSVGAVLLVTAFARLALNPAVFQYHARSSTAIFNWYLYSYGLVTACLFTGAHLLAPPRARVLGLHTPPLLNTLGTVLAFFLLNLEIADFFSAPGQRVLAFQFSASFASDMSYTIGWALFALGLLLASIWQHTRAGRYAAIALLSIALLKLFFHDLARLDALYRIGALFAVAVIATLASFAYQRFLPANEKKS